jgi:hypothetical protein
VEQVNADEGSSMIHGYSNFDYREITVHRRGAKVSFPTSSGGEKVRFSRTTTPSGGGWNAPSCCKVNESDSIVDCSIARSPRSSKRNSTPSIPTRSISRKFLSISSVRAGERPSTP